MIRFLRRFIGVWLLAGAFIVLVIDGTRSIAASSFTVTPFRDAWSKVNAHSLDATQQYAAAHLPAWLGASVLDGVLNTPLWIVFGLLGVLLLLFGRQRRRRIGYSARD